MRLALLSTLFAAIVLAAAGCATSRPERDTVYVPGHWAYGPAGSVWVDGYWVARDPWYRRGYWDRDDWRDHPGRRDGDGGRDRGPAPEPAPDRPDTGGVEKLRPR